MDAISKLYLIKISLSYTLSREYQVTENWYVRTRTIDKYDITMPLPRICMTPHIKYNDVTMLDQRRPLFPTMAKWAIDICFYGICVLRASANV